MMIMAPASALYISSTRNIADNRNNLIGASLAEESLEMVQNMRNTNFLRFSSRAEECWNAKFKKDDGSDIALSECHEPVNKIEPGFYRLDFDIMTDDPKLEPLAELHRTPSLPGQPLGPYDLTGPDDSYYQLLLDDATYNYNYTVGSSTAFYRQIEIRYFNLDSVDEGGGVDEEGMEVASTVLYRIGARVHSIERIFHLSNQKPL